MKISRIKNLRWVMQDHFHPWARCLVAALATVVVLAVISCARSCSLPKAEAPTPTPEPDYPIIIVERNWDMDPYIGILKIEQEKEREEQ